MSDDDILWANRDWTGLSGRLPTYTKWLKVLQRNWSIRDHALEDLAVDTLSRIWQTLQTGKKLDNPDFRRLFLSFSRGLLRNDWQKVKRRNKGKSRYLNAGYSELLPHDWIEEPENDRPAYRIDNEPKWFQLQVRQRADGMSWQEMADKRGVTKTAECTRFNTHARRLGGRVTGNRNNRKLE